MEVAAAGVGGHDQIQRIGHQYDFLIELYCLNSEIVVHNCTGMARR
jgi:hypothetical protein